ncbi:MAG: hypothetical protein ACJ796_14500 [Gemmatimonadaceae bacterium]
MEVLSTKTPFLLFASAALLGWSAGCQSHRSAPAPAVQQSSVGDSTYEIVLRKWLRDSTVIDSLSRLVPTDSVYRMYRGLLVAQDPAPLMQDIKCAEFALRWQYGSLPAGDAIRRMRDTVYSKADQTAVNRTEDRFPQTGMFLLSPSRCGITAERAPAEINGTSLSTRAILRPWRRKSQP